MEDVTSTIPDTVYHAESRIGYEVRKDGHKEWDISRRDIKQLAAYFTYHGVPVTDIAVGKSFGLILGGKQSVTHAEQYVMVVKLGFTLAKGGHNINDDWVIELEDNEYTANKFEKILSRVNPLRYV